MKLDLKKAAKEIAEKGMDQIKQTLKEYYNTTLEEVSLLANAKAEGRIIILPCTLRDKVYQLIDGRVKFGTIVSYRAILNPKTNEMEELVGLQYEDQPFYGDDATCIVEVNRNKFEGTWFTDYTEAIKVLSKTEKGQEEKMLSINWMEERTDD